MNAPFKVKFLKLYNKTFLGNFLSTSVTNVNFTVILSSRCKCTCDSGSVYYWGFTIVWGWGRSVFKL